MSVNHDKYLDTSLWSESWQSKDLSDLRILHWEFFKILICKEIQYSYECHEDKYKYGAVAHQAEINKQLDDIQDLLMETVETDNTPVTEEDLKSLLKKYSRL